MTDRTANLLGALSLLAGDRVRAAIGGELTAATTLAALATFADGASIDELSRILGLTHSGAVRNAARLEAAGLVRREPDQRDRRAVRVRLTAAGRDEATAVLAARREVLTELTETLDPTDRRALAPLLEKLLTRATHSTEAARRTCRLCEPDVCGHPERCPVTRGARQTGSR